MSYWYSINVFRQIPEGRIQVLKTDRNMNYQGSSRTSSTCLISEYNYSQCLTEIEKELTKLEDFITKKLGGTQK
ncbi:uncharacterized protein LOC143257436 isoform X4 [Tachypleus tridentatus]|uniref:uncharacterized protein LOC143257436 isoform X4 n=1 Tax=Tachypleus tridentatus TaxID=6853 RepID=UPI003FD69EAF